MKYIIRFSTLYIFWSDWIRSVKMNQNGSNWIKMDQNGSNLIKLDFWWNNHWYRLIFNFQFNLIRLNQICPKWIKMDQTWSNLISDEIIIQIYDQIFNFIYFLIRFNQICQNFIFFWSKWIRSVQNGSNLIKLYFWWNNHWNISSDFHLYLTFDQIKSDRSKTDQNGSNLKCAWALSMLWIDWEKYRWRLNFANVWKKRPTEKL